jgi:hypothetical protein
VVINCADTDVTLDDVDGRVRVGTDRARDGEAFSGSLQLRGWEGLLAEIQQ